MTPLFSLVVPVYNHAHYLPRLLDSVLAQGVGDMETVIVDDCSEQPCDETVSAYTNKGMSIKLIRNTERLYTKDSRLAGVAAAQGKYIGFADADDTLVGEKALRGHLDLMQAQGADVLHFRSFMSKSSGGFLSYFYRADPFAPELAGKDIFAAFSASDFSGAVIWNKIFSRHLFFDKILHENAFVIYSDDLFLNSILLFNAEKYIGSDAIGYNYKYEDREWEKSFGRGIAIYKIIEKVVPYLAANNCDPASFSAYVKKLRLSLSYCVGRANIMAVDDATGMVSDAACERLLHATDTSSLVKMLVLGGAINAEKLVTSFRAIAGTPGT